MKLHRASTAFSVSAYRSERRSVIRSKAGHLRVNQMPLQLARGRVDHEPDPVAGGRMGLPCGLLKGFPGKLGSPAEALAERVSQKQRHPHVGRNTFGAQSGLEMSACLLERRSLSSIPPKQQKPDPTGLEPDVGISRKTKNRVA